MNYDVLIVNRLNDPIVANCETVSPELGIKFLIDFHKKIDIHSDVGSAIMEYNSSINRYEYTTFGNITIIERPNCRYDVVSSILH